MILGLCHGDGVDGVRRQGYGRTGDLQGTPGSKFVLIRKPK